MANMSVSPDLFNQPKKSSNIVLNKRVKFFKYFRWFIIVLLILLIVVGIYVFQKMNMSFKAIDGDNPPKFIQADFVELDKVYSISKFRSGMGHDFSIGSEETCRSMKHYFSSMDPSQPNYKMISGGKDKKGGWPRPVEGRDVTIFSPVDGRVVNIAHEGDDWLQDEIIIVPDSNKSIRIRLLHITPINGIEFRIKVTAGQKVGLVLANQSFDLGIEQVTPWKTTYISYFAAMPDEVFAKYKARGVKNQNDLIFTKEYINAHPWQCVKGTEEFVENYVGTPEGDALNIVKLTGYDQISAQVRAQMDQYKK